MWDPHPYTDTPPPAPSHITILHLLAATTDGPPEPSPGQYQVVGEITIKRSVVITGAGAYDFSRKLLLVELESFGILIHATRTCRDTPTPAPSQRPRFNLGVTQRSSKRSSSAWNSFSRPTQPFPSGRSWRGTNWTNEGQQYVVYLVLKMTVKTFVFHVRVFRLPESGR